MNYNRGDVVILPFPFVTQRGVQQKARPALFISDHSFRRRFYDVILVAINSQRINNVRKTELLIEEGAIGFKESGLAKSSVVRCVYVMTVPANLIARKLGKFPTKLLSKIDHALRLSLGLKN